MWSCDDGLANFDPLYWTYLKNRGMYARLSKILAKDKSAKLMALDASCVSTYSLSKRTTLDRLFRPPKPKKTSDRASMVTDTYQSSFSFSRLASQPRTSIDITQEAKCEENKENICRGNYERKLPPASIQLGTPSGKAKKEFMIRKASPSRSLATDKSEITTTEKQTGIVKSSSVKYKNMVDQSRSVSTEVNMVSIVNELPKISAKSWVVLDGPSKEALFGYKYSIKREVASLTKLMTLFTACKIIEESKITARSFECMVSQNASSMIGTSANLKTGDQLSLHDLLYGTQI